MNRRAFLSASFAASVTAVAVSLVARGAAISATAFQAGATLPAAGGVARTPPPATVGVVHFPPGEGPLPGTIALPRIPARESAPLVGVSLPSRIHSGARFSSAPKVAEAAALFGGAESAAVWWARVREFMCPFFAPALIPTDTGSYQ